MGTFSERMTYLYKTIREMDSFETLSKQPSIILFLSLGYRDKRAVVFSTNKASLDDAWENLYEQASQYHKIDSTPVDFLKIDWVDSQATLPIPRFIEILTKTKKNYFRKGISFDPQFKHALLEQEVNANEIIQYNEKTGRAFLNAHNIKSYIENRPGMSIFNLREVESITIFTTQAVFLEEAQCYPLKNDSFNNGRRDTALTPRHLQEMILSGMKYLTNLNITAGKFTYGYYPCGDKEIESYNMLRHGNALYAMLEAYELFKNENTAQAIKRGLHFLVKHGMYIDERKDVAYVVDQVGHKSFEVKLGANAFAIIAIVKYTEVFHDESYLHIAKMLARGIVKLQQKQGNFTHVLDFPTLNVKEAFRISNYDSEATLSLLRLYRIDPNIEWLLSAEKAMDFFIVNEAWKKPDHWLSHCVNETVKHNPSSQYVKFGLQLVRNRLDFIDKQAMIFPSLLEMTIATYELVQHQKDMTSQRLLQEFPSEKIEAVIHRRAEYQRNGYFYPELAIYFKNPKSVMGGFFSRYHSFRTRIDDVANYLSGYCQYYRLFFTNHEETIEEPEQLVEDSVEPEIIPKDQVIEDRIAELGKEETGQQDESIETVEDITDDPAVRREFVSVPDPSLDYLEKASPDVGESTEQSTQDIMDNDQIEASERPVDLAIDDSKEEENSEITADFEKPNEIEIKVETVQQSEKIIFSLTNQVVDFSQRVEVLTNELAALRMQTEELEEKQQAAVEASATTVQVNELSRRLAELTNELTALRNQAEELEEVKASVAESATITSRVDELSRQLADLTDELTTLRSQAEELAEKTEATIHSSATTVQVNELSSRLADLTNEMTTIRNKTEENEKLISTKASAISDHVLVLSEQLADLTNELTTLKNQAEKLEEKQKAAVEASATTAHVEEITLRIAELTKMLTALRNQADELEVNKAAVAESAVTNNRVDDLSHQLAELTNEVTTLSKQAEEIEEKQKATVEASATTAQVDELSHKLEELTNELTTLSKQAEELQEKQETTIETYVTTSQADEFSRRLAELTTELTFLRNQTEELKEKQKSAEEAMVTTARVEELSLQLAELTTGLTTLSKQAEELQQNQEAAIENYVTTSRVDELSHQLADLTTGLTTLKQQAQELAESQKFAVETSTTTARVEELSQQLAELTTGLITLSNQSGDHKKQASTETAAKSSQVLALSRRLAELNNLIITIRNQALEHKSQASREAAATSDQVMALSRQLAELTNKLATLRRQSKELEEKQEDAAIEAYATTNQVEGLSRQVADLSNELITFRKQTEDHEKQASTNASATSKQVDELSDRLMELTNELTTVSNQAEDHKKQVSREAAATSDQVMVLSRQLAELTAELITLGKQATDLEEKQEAAVKVSATIGQVEALSCRLEELANELTGLRQQAEDHKKQASREVAATSDHVLALSRQLAELTSELSTLRVQSKELEDYQVALADSSATTGQVEELSGKIAAVTAELTTLRNQAEDHKKQVSRELTATGDHVLALSRQLAKLTSDLTTLRRQSKEFEDKQEALAESAATTNQVEMLSRQLADLTIELITQRKQVEKLEQALLKIEKDRENWIMAGLLNIARLKDHEGIPELSDLVKEILKQLTAEDLSAEQAQDEKQQEPNQVQPDKEAVEGVPEEDQELQQPVLEELPSEIEESEQEKEDRAGSFQEDLSVESEQPKIDTEFVAQPEEEISTVPEQKGPDSEESLEETKHPNMELDEPLEEQEKPRGLKRIFPFLRKKKKPDQETKDTESDLLSEDVTAQVEKEAPVQVIPDVVTAIPKEFDQDQGLETSETELKKTADVEPGKLKDELEVEGTSKEKEGVQETSPPPEEKDRKPPVDTLEGNLKEIVLEGEAREEVETATQEKRPKEQIQQISEKQGKSSKEEVLKIVLPKVEKKDSLLTEAIKPEERVAQTGNLAEIEKLIVELEETDKSFKRREATEKVKKLGKALEEAAKERKEPTQRPLEEPDEKQFEQDWDSVSEQLFEKHREVAGAEEKSPVSTEARSEQLDAPDVTEIQLRKDKDKKRKRNKLLKTLGNILIIFGLLVTTYFAYQVISTKLAEQKALKEAENNLNLNGNPNGESVDQEDPEAEAKKKEEIIKNYQAEFGKAFATVEIPKLQKTLPIIEGTDPDVLDKGVGHLKQSVFPGQNEQIVISGHRDTVFRGFEKLEIGDHFVIRMPYGTYTYEMRETEIVDEDDTTVVRSMGEEVLVVTTCYPFYYIGNAPQRFVIYAYPVKNE